MTLRSSIFLLPLALLVGCKSAPSDSGEPQSGVDQLQAAFTKYAKAKTYHAKSKITISADGKPIATNERTYDIAGPNMVSIRYTPINTTTIGSAPATFIVTNAHEMVEGEGRSALRYPSPPNIVAVNASELLNKSWPHGTLVLAFFAGSAGKDLIAASIPMIDGRDKVNGVDCVLVKFSVKGPWGTTTLAIDEKTGFIVRVSAKMEPLVAQLPPKLAGTKSLLFQEDFSEQKFDAEIDPKTFDSSHVADKFTLGTTPQGWLKVGDVAPNFEIKRADGSTVSSATLKGKVVYVDFWATWCGPCKQTLPNTQATFNKHKDDPNLAVLAVTDDPVAKAKSFVENEKYTFPLAIDADQSMHRSYGINSIPTFLVIDKAGKIAFLINGAYDGIDRDIEKVITQSLAEKS